jgi:ElaB/YqjD/DUF883 family membrane-anchored ribosome-binding protein
MAIRVGDRGVAESSLHPQGVIRVEGRRYPARAEHGTVSPDAPVFVVAGDQLGLVVRPVELDMQPAALPGFGEPVHASFLDRLAQEGERDEVRQRTDETARRRRGAVVAAVAGSAAAVLVLALVSNSLDLADDAPWAAVGVALAAGAVWGAGVFLQLNEALRRFDARGGRISAICTGLALVGGAAGAAVGIPTFGLTGGLSLAAIGTVTCGLALPLLIVFADDLGPAA